MLDDAFDVDELDDEEDEFPDVLLAADHETNDPEYLNPDPPLGVLRHIEKVLSDADAQLEGEPYLCDPGNPNNSYRFRSNDKFIVVYGSAANGKYDSLWAGKGNRRGNGSSTGSVLPWRGESSEIMPNANCALETGIRR